MVPSSLARGVVVSSRGAGVIGPSIVLFQLQTELRMLQADAKAAFICRQWKFNLCMKFPSATQNAKDSFIKAFSLFESSFIHDVTDSKNRKNDTHGDT
jgi:hypothetical protein